MTIADRVDVITGARLHFGLICGTPASGWLFGGVGLMVRDPGWKLRVSRSGSATRIRGASDCVMRRIETVVGRCQDLLSIPETAFDIQVLQQTPLHSGYGAGTQLALSVGAAMNLLIRRRNPGNVSELARLLGRAERSAIGTAGFLQGGFLVDRGVQDAVSAEHALQRYRLPDEWRFVLIRPIESVGLSGDEERAFFSRKQTMSGHTVRVLSEFIEQELTPAVVAGDFAKFATALAAYGRTVGEYYAIQQGDVFSDPLMQLVATRLTANGFPGAAQSSWGPGICVPAASRTDAREIEQFVRGFAESPALQLHTTEPLNNGATIRTAAFDRCDDQRLA